MQQLSNRVALLTPLEVYERLPELSNGLILLDVRTRVEWMLDGHIEGAIHIPMAHLTLQLDKLSQSKEIIVYCAHGIRSPTVAAMLAHKLGYPRVGDMQGGLEAWIKAGLPIVRR